MTLTSRPLRCENGGSMDIWNVGRPRPETTSACS